MSGRSPPGSESGRRRLDWPAVSLQCPPFRPISRVPRRMPWSTSCPSPRSRRELAARFAVAGHRLYLVGGTVRDALLGRAPSNRSRLHHRRAARRGARARSTAGPSAVWDTGIAFGTVGARRRGTTIEITTFRADAYDRVSRNPVVAFGETIEDDLVRRDFTRQRDGGRAHGRRGRYRRFVDPYRRARRAGGRRARHARPRPRSRSPTTRCGCCARPGSSRSSGSRPRRAWSRR